MDNDVNYDVAIIGCGTSGMVSLIHSATAGLKTLLIDASPGPGGTLQIATGQLSAAGTKLQKSLGIIDSPEIHFADVMKISRYSANPTLVKRAVDNAAETFDWLVDRGYTPLDEHPVLGEAHEPYSVARYYWGEELGRSILAALKPDLDRALASPNVHSHFNTRLTELIGGQNGSPITGFTAINEEGQTLSFKAKNVVLATGGYNGSPTEFQKRIGRTLPATESFPFSRGDGHNIVENIGGSIRGKEHFLCSFGSVLESYEIPSKIAFKPEHRPQIRNPWEIYVNLNGERFINEDNPSVDLREHSLLQQPEMRRFIVFDEKIKNSAPTMFTGVSEGLIDSLYGNHPMFLKSETVQGLANQMGVPAENLAKTISDYNEDKLDTWGRKHKPLKISSGPYYAVSVHGISIVSASGVAVDDQLRVVVDQNLSVPNLYAIGEIIGSSQMMGGSFAGGMQATPAMTFGRLVARQIIEKLQGALN